MSRAMSLWGDCAWHPAVAAWRELAPDAPDPESIEVLRRGQKSATYRLVGAGPGGAPIIAQHARGAKASIERAVYEPILAHPPVTPPRCHRFRGDAPP